MINWNKISKKDTAIINKIVNRAITSGFAWDDKISLQMDITAAHIASKLKLKELFDADDFNFGHDIHGIQKNINRDSGEMENFFLPRFTR